MEWGGIVSLGRVRGNPAFWPPEFISEISVAAGQTPRQSLFATLGVIRGMNGRDIPDRAIAGDEDADVTAQRHDDSPIFQEFESPSNRCAKSVGQGFQAFSA